ncbi:hypothetical protein D3C76_1162290 [compost metagenome]
MLVVLDVNRLATNQGGADGIGARMPFLPVGAGAKAHANLGVDETLGAPGSEQSGLGISQKDQAIGVAEDVFVVRQNLLMRDFQQPLLFVEPLPCLLGRGVAKIRQ